uniref:Poly(A) polymerase catalytic subunit domain-containing protein n=1 Tax=viral metagenome TaxID=1070528 RepID=A0A6C0E6K8_9ZZZZ
MTAKIKELVSLVKAAAAEAADFQERFAAEDTEARKIVDIMEHFLRIKGRVVYGGAAINAHLSPATKFYDPKLYLPDYDFMTPDPLQDCADLMSTFYNEGFREVEAKFGIHEGTYKIFVNFRAAADITYVPPEIYERVIRDAREIAGIHYASVNFLRMNMYLELSRPAGMVSRWEKVYERLLLLNSEYPIRAGTCPKQKVTTETALHKKIVAAGIKAGVVFLSGVGYLNKGKDTSRVVLMMSDKPATIKEFEDLGLEATRLEPLGEILPPRTELRHNSVLVAVVFETDACHSYTTLKRPAGYRLGSIDLLIQMYYAMYFANITEYTTERLLCLIKLLVELESSRRLAALKQKLPLSEVFPLECIGHQPTMPELKRAHRDRVEEKRDELKAALKIDDAFKLSRRSKSKQLAAQ